MGSNDVLRNLEDSFETWATSYVVGELAATAGFSWLLWPVVSTFAPLFILRVVHVLTKSAVMRAMFLSTAALSEKRATEYGAAVQKKRAAKSGPKDDYAKAETAEVVAFCNLVMGRK